MDTALISSSLDHGIGMTEKDGGIAVTAVLADDHEMVRAGISTLLKRVGGCDVLAEVADGRSAVRCAHELSPDLIVLDITLPLLDGIEATRQIISQNPAARVIVYAADHTDTLIDEAFRAGARSFLLQSSAGMELAIAVGAVMRDEVYLSPKAAGTVVDKYIRRLPPAMPRQNGLSAREGEVLHLLSQGMTNKQIAAHLEISVRTVEARRMQVMEKLNIHNVAELTKYAIREGITSLES